VAYNTSGVIGEQNVAPAGDVTLSYDAAGNRTQMQDRFGTVTYEYQEEGAGLAMFQVVPYCGTNT
jgi:YD repeat-containing protein